MPGSYGLGAGTGSLAGMTGWGWGSYTGPANPFFAGNLALVYCKKKEEKDSDNNSESSSPNDNAGANNGNAFVASRLFACTSSSGVGGGVIGDIIPRAPVGVVCVNSCANPLVTGSAAGDPSTTCVPCSDPGLVCAREFGRGLGGALVGGGSSFGGGGGGGGLLGGGSSIGNVWLAEEIGKSSVMCPTPGADGGRALANTIPLI